MTNEERARLRSLVERIIPYRDGLHRLVGPIGPLELQALRAAMGDLNGAPRSDSDVPDPTIVAQPASLTVTLDTAIHSKTRPEGLLCIDFGTAASKAAYDLGGDEPEPLALGTRGSDPDGIFWISSTIAVDPNGLVLLGGAAEAFLRANPSAPGLRSFKSQLWGDPALLHQQALADGGVSFSFGDCLLAYLACLSRLISLELEDAGEDRHMPRRYAMPYAYDPERIAVRKLLGIMIGQAAILADTLGDELIAGVPAPKLRAALDAVAGVTAPAWLTDTDPACIGESVAAGAFAMDQELAQLTVYMIVDVGAGTTDFCILCLKNKADGTFEPIQIRNGSLSVACAGDTLDEALKGYIRDTWGWEDVERTLGLGLRSLKEALFQHGGFTHDLADATPFTLDREEFLGSPQWQGFLSTLTQAQEACFAQADQKYLLDYGSGAIRIVLTGGGSALPLSETLATGRIRHLMRTPTSALPDGLRDRYAEIENDLPRLAVALGGSFEITPIEQDRTEAKTSLGITAPRIWRPIDKTSAGLDEEIA